jgi:hypothetical protein
MRTSLLLTTLLGLAVPAVAQSVGEKIADATFPEFLNGDGRQKLSDFYGQPIVIDLWGTR